MSDSGQDQTFFLRLESIEDGYARLSIDGTDLTLPAYLLPADAQPGDGLRATLSVDSSALEEHERTTSSLLADLDQE